ncbi:FAD binding domain-containing protein [Tindallia californiensis]|uniref:Carbon-monoxide dehydrogenase medium subunit n=1 Tax=Tindallia californiensis TaxID=159292 RepID=A0A1H3Q416_9FIRM|nr:xanthine dehydrogenase family protein subunit M [Tindallia californiensis]SDZ07980.1 carbon-monoxide dehydrogenase medium subunit [Tindallia californiensis]
MISKFNYSKPQTTQEAIDFLSANPGTKILAGGTDLMISLRRNVEMVDNILDVKGIEELHRFDYKNGEGLYIGATVLVNELAESDTVIEKYPALSQAAGSLASYQLRNRATLVGNICNASPGADLSSPLLTYQATVHIEGPNGKRELALENFFTGVKKTALKDNEIVLGVSLPDVEPGDMSEFRRQTRVKGHDLATVGITIRRTADKRTFIAMAAVAPTPIRLKEVEKELMNMEFSKETAQWLKAEIQKHIKPISDVRSSLEYRLLAAGALANKAMMAMIEKGAK